MRSTMASALMTRGAVLAAALVMVIAGGSAARADSIYEVEGARANARAGGPISEHDAWLLERYGATSGTPDWRYRPRRSTVELYYDDEPRYGHRHKHKRRSSRY